MNKKESVAYAQVALNFMQSSKYTGEVNPEALGVEMRQAFKLYPRNLIVHIAESQLFASEKIKQSKNVSDVNEWWK